MQDHHSKNITTARGGIVNVKIESQIGIRVSENNYLLSFEK
jgi:hypothetical protein